MKIITTSTLTRHQSKLLNLAEKDAEAILDRMYGTPALLVAGGALLSAIAHGFWRDDFMKWSAAQIDAAARIEFERQAIFAATSGIRKKGVEVSMAHTISHNDFELHQNFIEDDRDFWLKPNEVQAYLDALAKIRYNQREWPDLTLYDRAA